MSGQYICCTFKIERSCGCSEDVNYSGSRTGNSMDKYIKKQETKMCTNCYELAIKKMRGC